MATTPKRMQDDEAAYSAAFDEQQPAAAEQSEDQAFGIEPEAAAAAPAEAVPAEAAAPAEAMPPEAVEPPAQDVEADAVPGEDASSGDVTAEAPPAVGDDLERERQRLRSWEGRLKAAEAALKAKGAGATEEAAEPGEAAESPAAEALEQVGEQAEQAGNEELGDAAEQAAEQVESGEMTAEQAMKTLAEDFGEEFVKMIEVIAKSMAKEIAHSTANEAVGAVRKDVDSVIGEIVDAKTRAHFSQIASKHPDFREIGQSQAFADWIQAMPADQQGQARQVAESGRAAEIIQLLDQFKASTQAKSPEAEQPAADPVVDESAMDDAEGVRSSGMALPDQPKPAADGYEDAWKDF